MFFVRRGPIIKWVGVVANAVVSGIHGVTYDQYGRWRNACNSVFFRLTLTEQFCVKVSSVMVCIVESQAGCRRPNPTSWGSARLQTLWRLRHDTATCDDRTRGRLRHTITTARPKADPRNGSFEWSFARRRNGRWERRVRWFSKEPSSWAFGQRVIGCGVVPIDRQRDIGAGSGCFRTFDARLRPRPVQLTGPAIVDFPRTAGQCVDDGGSGGMAGQPGPDVEPIVDRSIHAVGLGRRLGYCCPVIGKYPAAHTGDPS